MPATLSLTLGPAATFGPFQPGVTRDYTASTTANVISTAGDAALTVADPSTNHPGHLVNGAFFLPQPLKAAGSALPATVKTWTQPVSNDALTIPFTQSIAATDALRTGTYSQDADVHPVHHDTLRMHPLGRSHRPPHRRPAIGTGAAQISIGPAGAAPPLSPSGRQLALSLGRPPVRTPVRGTNLRSSTNRVGRHRPPFPVLPRRGARGDSAGTAASCAEESDRRDEQPVGQAHGTPREVAVALFVPDPCPGMGGEQAVRR